MTRFPLLGLSRLRMQTDGTGVTTLVAGAGCPLTCKWCINRRILSEKRPELLSPQELFARVRCDDLYFRATGGGVTFGGGEPLLHAAFLAEFRALCPDWRLTVETSLNVAPGLLAQCEKAVDEFIVDIKDWDETVYYAYTGHSGAQARENLRHLLTSSRAKVHVRVPLIPQFNTPEQQTATAAALRALGAENIELFSYVLRENCHGSIT